MADVQMDFEMMRQMTAAFEEAGAKLDEAMNGLNGIAGMVEGGALVGKGGQQLGDLILNGIIPFTQVLRSKMEELAGDVDGARAFMEEGDEFAASRFK